MIALVLSQQAAIERLEARLAELEAGEGKRRGLAGNKIEPKKPEWPKAERKQREQSFVRKRMAEPDERVKHAYDNCPGCGTGLGGGSVKRTREVIEIRPSPAVVTEHVFIERCCPICEQRYTPPAQLEGVTVGKSRLGVGLVSVIATLREEARLPVEKIAWYLRTFHRLSLSAGAIVLALRRVAQRGKEQVGRILDTVRASPFINADETGWRENGNNGFAWVCSTPGGCYFLRAGRDRGVVERLLVGSFQGVLCCDFYASYNCYPGPIQRCWVHLLRDIHEVVAKHPQDVMLAGWAERVREVYEEAKRFVTHSHELRERYAEQWRLREKLLLVCEAYPDGGNEPQARLCARIRKHVHELFVFVLYPGVPSHNNNAERSLRHLVTTRKISGGTRSGSGSDTKMALSTLFSTWRARDQNPYNACLQLLTSPHP